MVENRRVSGGKPNQRQVLYLGEIASGQRALAPGLTPRDVLEKFAAIQMPAVHFPAMDGRTHIFTR